MLKTNNSSYVENLHLMVWRLWSAHYSFPPHWCLLCLLYTWRFSCSSETGTRTTGKRNSRNRHQSSSCCCSFVWQHVAPLNTYMIKGSRKKNMWTNTDPQSRQPAICYSNEFIKNARKNSLKMAPLWSRSQC